MRFSQANNSQPQTPLSPLTPRWEAELGTQEVENTESIQNTKEITQNIDSVRLAVSGMRCASCSASIENELRKKEGIKEANVYILNNTAVIKFDKETCDIDSIISCIESLGFKAKLATKSSFTLANNKNQANTNFSLKSLHTTSSSTFNMLKDSNPLECATESKTQKIENTKSTQNNTIESNLYDTKKHEATFIESESKNTDFVCHVERSETSKTMDSLDSTIHTNNDMESSKDISLNAQYDKFLDSKNSKMQTAEVFLSDFSGFTKESKAFGAKGEGSYLSGNDRALSEQSAKSTTCAKHQSKLAKKTTQNLDSTKDTKQQNILQKINHYIEHTLLNDKRRLIFSIILSLVIVYISMLHDMFSLPLPQILHNPIYNGLTQLFITLCVMHFGRSIYFHGLKALFALRPNMDSLVSVGSLSGFLYSCFSLAQMLNGIESHLYFESVCVILSFIMLGKFMEENAKNKAIKNAKSLLQRQSEIALKIINPHDIAALKTEEISPYNLQIGDYIQILPHSFIPIDSILYSNDASIDESMLSGESIPIRKEKGMQLFAGTLNLDTPIIARVSHTLSDSKISKMQSLLEQTLESKANIAKLADRISLIFVPLVMFLATCSGIFWFIYENLESAMLYFSSTLLISCPCALGLATPMAILFANARANHFGIFFKNAQSLESLSKTDYVVFDKTGTLTKRDFSLHSIFLQENISENELLRIAASIEISSNHIIAKAICESFHNKSSDTQLYKQLDSKHYMNAGIESKLLIDSKERVFLIGNAKLLKDRAGLSVETDSIKGRVCVYIAEIMQDRAILLGRIYLAEALKPYAQEMIAMLKTGGFQCEILSGDMKKNVGYIADILGIPYKAECLPEDKMRYIESLQNKGHKVIMIGDGANDSIAIAKADLSLVMASGSEVSIEYGNIIYFRDDLLGIVEALHLGRKTLHNIKQNLGFAFLYNIICIPIAMGIFSPFGVMLNPMLASLAMSLSSISVVGNASRLYGVWRS
ncbi:heavy metal translocating P-type ATPase [Helicobacter bilis]|uniref:heavy metal translocating P-type ATPase n=1 Tax=Helicobacter bilis TaxID=37372 RepID=UPI00051DC169|nr:heavy metal translocating P-type ATPase [Helicobacter bilis]TLE07410.1 heavy metal translocating P-type ATPase [Helicobacter bilis]